MSSLDLIFRRRQYLGLRYQEPHRKDLIHLAHMLKTANVPHPYCSEAWDLIKWEEAFGNVQSAQPKGPPFVFGPPLDSSPPFIYRIHRVDQITWLPYLSEHLRTAGRIAGRLREEVADAQDWLTLASYARSPICNSRNFSWWTTMEPPIDPAMDPPVDHAAMLVWVRELGIPSNHLRPNMMLLQLDWTQANGLALAHVPSALEGFDATIFHPQRYTSPLRPGLTISLNDFPNSLSPGKEEFALAPIPASALRFFPLPVLTPEHGVPLTDELFALLAAYYLGL